MRLDDASEHFYNCALFWIIRERPGGGWPPRDPVKVAGWLLVRLVADVFGKSVKQVALDLIERSQETA
jgi:hypothetical protein